MSTYTKWSIITSVAMFLTVYFGICYPVTLIMSVPIYGMLNYPRTSNKTSRSLA